VKLDDLLDMLRAEFALDVPTATATMAEWQLQPDAVPSGLADMLSFLDRSAEVVQIVGLQGLAGFLQQVRSFSELISQPGTAFSPPGAPNFTRPSSIKWLSSWVEKVTAYLDKPADPQAVEAMAKYLYRCPLKPDTDAVLDLAALLAIAPSLPRDDPDSAPLELAQDADVVLPTEDVDTDLLQALLIDAPQQLEQLEAILQRWAVGLATDVDMLEAQRISHTFKGSGNIIGLPGIGRVAHRLEDILEYALDATRERQAVNPAMARDSLRAVLTLQQMTAFLQGEEAAPQDAKSVLQRLLDWVQWIRDGEALTASPQALPGSAAAVLQAQSTDAGMASTEGAAQAPAAASDGTTLRVGVDRVSRMLRRAGQSIVQTQRLSQLLLSANERLEAVARSQQQLAERLRELDAIVGSQAVALREHQKDGDFDPLEMDRYDALHVLSRTITEAMQDGQELVQQIQQDTGIASNVIRDEGYSLTDQHRELLAARLIPVKTMGPRLKRNVAQTASATGKQVALNIQGDAVTMDADVLGRLTEPLLHLLRNAVDHGIEMPDERLALGKPEHGTVTVSFKRVGQEVEIVVLDDGRGLDLARIEEKALAFGLIAPGTQLDESELRRMILRPGFSTRDKVTEVSGRGVGMDVVNDRISALKGRLDIGSTALLGSRFTLHVPVSSGVAHALIVQCAQESVALSTDQVLTVLPAGQAEVTRQGEQLSLHHDGKTYPAFVLSQWLGFDEIKSITPQQAAQLLPVLVKGAHGDVSPIALLVDAVIDSRELILQGIGQLARRIRGVVAGALRADGKPLFLIDVAELERAARSSVQLVSSSALRKRLAVERTRVLVVDDALSVRRSMQQLLGDAGYDVATAADGFEAIEQIRLKRPALMLTDLEMPNLNGLELTRRVREVQQWMDMPIVMITSRAGDKHRQIASEAGVDVYLTKPYLDADLLNHVRTLSAVESQTDAVSQSAVEADIVLI
jgi:chemosensory pili system protein ChpA (sensor histidine kinase/response regulator)